MYVMERRVPADNISLIDPFLYFSFILVGLAASIAIITALCSVRFRRKSSPPPTSSDPSEMTKALNASTPPSTMEATAISPEQPQILVSGGQLEYTTDTENNGMLIKELPLPPAMQHPKDSYISNSMVKRATSERRLSFNLSLKMPRSWSMAKNWDQKEDNDGGKKGKLKTDESVWMKTIILGEKCVPDEEADAVIYEGKGKKVSAYHPKNSSSMSLSRQWSFIDPDVLSVPQTQSQEERINNI